MSLPSLRECLIRLDAMRDTPRVAEKLVQLNADLWAEAPAIELTEGAERLRSLFELSHHLAANLRNFGSPPAPPAPRPRQPATSIAPPAPAPAPPPADTARTRPADNDAAHAPVTAVPPAPRPRPAEPPPPDGWATMAEVLRLADRSEPWLRAQMLNKGFPRPETIRQDGTARRLWRLADVKAWLAGAQLRHLAPDARGGRPRKAAR